MVVTADSPATEFTVRSLGPVTFNVVTAAVVIFARVELAVAVVTFKVV